MLSNYIASRIAGVNGLTIPNDVRSMSLELGQMAKSRNDALEHLRRGGRVNHLGFRLDARGGVSDKAIRKAAMDLRAAEWVAAYRSAGRMDATVPQASQALTEFLSEVYTVEKSGLAAWDKEILDVDQSFDPAAEEIVWYERDLVGAPRAGNTYDVTTIPMVTGPTAGSNRIRVIPALVGMDINFMDGRRASMARSNGKPDFAIEQGKIEICRRSIAEMANALWLAGDSSLGVDGLHNSPLIGAIPGPAGAWSTLTGVQLVAELDKLFNFIPNNAQGGALRDITRVYVMLPPDQHDLITSTPVTASGDRTVWEFFRESHGLSNDNLKKIYEFAAANSAVIEGGTGVLARDRAYVCYKVGDRWDPRFCMPQPIEIPAPPRNTGVGEVTYMHARMGGIMIPDARRIKFYEGL